MTEIIFWGDFCTTSNAIRELQKIYSVVRTKVCWIHLHVNIRKHFAITPHCFSFEEKVTSLFVFISFLNDLPLSLRFISFFLCVFEVVKLEILVTGIENVSGDEKLATRSHKLLFLCLLWFFFLKLRFLVRHQSLANA